MLSFLVLGRSGDADVHDEYNRAMIENGLMLTNETSKCCLA